MRDFTGVSGASGGLAKLTPAPATRWTPEVGNAIVQEIANVITAPLGGNAALDPGDNTQLFTAIAAMVGRFVSVSAGATQRTITLGGIIIKIGSNLGYFVESSVYTPFDVEFPTACWIVIPIARNDDGNQFKDIAAQVQGAPSTAGFTTRLNFIQAGGTNAIDGFDYIAIGD